VPTGAGGFSSQLRNLPPTGEKQMSETTAKQIVHTLAFIFYALVWIGFVLFIGQCSICQSMSSLQHAQPATQRAEGGK
jgi:hypothetical protein